jgi:peptide/nickel transport system permease protein
MSVLQVGAGVAPTVFGKARKLRGAVLVATCVLVVFAVVAIVGPWLAPHDPNAVSLADVFGPPSPAHPLGFDVSGRDLFSRIIVGARTSIVGPLLLVLASTVVGVAAALVAAWMGGIVDAVISRLFDVTLALPGLLLAIVAAAVFGASLTTAALALSISYVPYVGRVVRAEAVRERHRAYVHAAWLQGMSATRICLTQILPNLVPLVIAQVVLSLSYAVIDLAAVSYLGLGIQPPTADWGTMVAGGQNSVLQGFPIEIIAASACIVALVMSLGIVGDALSERADRS